MAPAKSSTYGLSGDISQNEPIRDPQEYLSKSSPIFKFKYGPSCFLKVFVVIFDFEVGVPWFYLVNLHQFSSLSMVDHVLTVFVNIFDFKAGVPGFIR